MALTSEEIAVELATIKANSESTNTRLSKVEESIKNIEKLSISIERLAMSVENIANKQDAYGKKQDEFTKKQNELVDKITEVEKLPDKEKARKHDDLMKQIMILVVGAVIGFVFKALLGI